LHAGNEDLWPKRRKTKGMIVIMSCGKTLWGCVKNGGRNRVNRQFGISVKRDCWTETEVSRFLIIETSWFILP
jgi:hypothetical protein